MNDQEIHNEIHWLVHVCMADEAPEWLKSRAVKLHQELFEENLKQAEVVSMTEMEIRVMFSQQYRKI